MTNVYLIRHAEAEGNIFRRAHGQYNGLIIGKGYKQINRLSERFRDINIDAVYSSDLTRTCVTASAIYKPKNLPLNKDRRLREVNMGEWEDISWGDLEHSAPQMMRYFESEPDKWQARSSENCQQVTARMIECISEIAAKHDGQSIALFSHGFAIRSFMQGILHIDAADLTKIPLFDNTAVTLLKYNNGEFTIEYQGDNSHIPVEESTLASQTWWREEKERIRENLRFLPYLGARDNEMYNRCLQECGIKGVESSYGPAGSEDIGGNVNKKLNESVDDSSGKVKTLKTAAFLGEQQVGLLWVSIVNDSKNDAVSSYDVVSNSEEDSRDNAKSNENAVSNGDAKAKEDVKGNNDAKGRIDCIYVKPEFRGKHYAIQMVGEAVSNIRKQRIAKLSVVVNSGGDAERFFSAYGFRKSDEPDTGDFENSGKPERYGASVNSITLTKFDGLCVMENDYNNWDIL